MTLSIRHSPEMSISSAKAETKKIEAINLKVRQANKIDKLFCHLANDVIHYTIAVKIEKTNSTKITDWVDAFLFVLLKLDAGILEQVNRVLSIHVLCKVEFEVELPRGGSGFGKFSFVIEEGESKLDDL